MCYRERCAFCLKVKLGLPMAWRNRVGGSTEQGHVCYGCEDEQCLMMQEGTSTAMWLDTLEDCK